MSSQSIKNNICSKISAYSHEYFLPCKLREIVTSVPQKQISDIDRKVGLKEDIHAIPLTKGYILYTKNLVLHCDNLDPLRNIDGSHYVDELINTFDFGPLLNTLYYYDLLTFDKNLGQLIVKEVPSKYRQLYASGNYVNFPLVPIAVEIDLTNECNFSCIHCSRDAKSRGTDKSFDCLSVNEFKRIIDECIEIGVIKIILMGGEPFYYKHFFDLVKYAKEKGIRTLGTSTNGWFINNKTAKKLAQYFGDIQVSIHGASSFVHDSIVGKKGAWERVKSAIIALKRNNLRVNVSFTVMRENIHDIHKMPQLVKDWGGDTLRYLCVNDSEGRGCSLTGWNIEEVYEIGEKLKNVYKSRPEGLELAVGGFPPLHPIRNDACTYGTSAGMNLLSVKSDGNIRFWGDTQGNFFNIRKNSLLDIWHSAKFIQLRKQSDCDCNYRSICYGPCKI